MHRRNFFNLLPTLGIFSCMGNSLHSAITSPTYSATHTEETFPADWLDEWNRATIHPIIHSSAPEESIILHALRSHQSLTIRYHRGSSPGAQRMIRPILLFTKSDYHPTYLLAWCYTRQQQRTFNLDAIELHTASSPHVID